MIAVVLQLPSYSFSYISWMEYRIASSQHHGSAIYT
jgi:hypothetical protein